MIKQNKGITLISLIITIAVMLIIVSTTTYTSLKRFEINKLKRMYNDIELLNDKVSNYYLKYNGLPIIRDSQTNEPVKYNYNLNEFLNIERNQTDNENYYILDLSAMDNITLNYGEEGLKNANKSDDVYIINDSSHMVYYARGIELNGVMYYYISNDDTNEDNNIPPTKPEINVISGKLSGENIYRTGVELEIIPGKDNKYGFDRMEMQIEQNGSIIVRETYTESKVITVDSDGSYVITVHSINNKGNSSEDTTFNFTIEK